MSPPRETEALIIGGGPAGLAAAIALRQRNISCVVVEARSLAIDKACGEGLMPNGRDALAQLGISLDQRDGQLFDGIRFLNPSHSAEAHFQHGPGIGVRRLRLHALLTERAREAGAHLLFNSHVALPANSSPSPHTASIDGTPIRFRWLIAAEGQASSIRRWAGLDPVRSHSQRFCLRTHYRIDPASASPSVEVHWSTTGQLYLTPVAHDCICAAYITRDPARIRPAARAAILSDFPSAAARLQSATPLPGQSGAVTSSRRLRRVATSNIALIGDASGSADAITGEGLALAFRQALALAECIAAGSLAPYQSAHRRILRLPHAMGSLLLALDRSPALQSRAIRALATHPIIFHELLEAHTGHTPLATVLLRRAPRFTWNLLTSTTPA